jgi:hypothetical protein
MTLFHYYIPSFNGGLQDPLSYSRVDLPQQKFGLRGIENGLIYPQGPVVKRSGTRFVAPRRHSTNCKLVSFDNTSGTSFLLEFSDQSVRFYTNKSPIMVDSAKVTNGTFPANITGWTNGSTGTAAISWDGTNFRMNLTGASASVSQASQQVTALLSGYTTYSLSLDVVGNPVTVKIGSAAGSSSIASDTLAVGTGKTLTFFSNASSFYITLQNPNNNVAQVDNIVLNQQYTLTSPYTSADIRDIQYDSKADSLIITHQNYQPRQLTWAANNSWSFTTLSMIDGPYYGEKDLVYGGEGSRKTITPSVTGPSAAVTLTSSSALFAASDVGKWIRARNLITNAWGAAKITAYASSTSVTANNDIAGSRLFPAASSSAFWQMSYFSSTGPWPKCVAVFEDRIFYGNISSAPNALFGTVSGTLEYFSPDADFNDLLSPTSALTLSVPKGRLNWLIANQRLFAGTSADIFAVTGTAAGLSYDTAKCRQTAISSASTVLPVQTQNSVVFANGFNTSIYSANYTFVEDSFSGTLLSGPIASRLKDGISELVYQETPLPILWVRTVNNELYGFTYQKDQKVGAWHSHTLGGTSVVINGMASCRGPIQDNLWLAITRTINGSSFSSIEFMEDLFLDKDKEDAFFVDCGVQYSGTSTTTIPGLSHLIGAQVDILRDGSLEPRQTVSASGTITLGTAATNVSVGLPYTFNMTPNLHEGGIRSGFSQTLPQKISKVSLRVVDTVNISVGISGISQTADPIPFNSSQVLGAGITPFTGTKVININSGWIREPTVTITSDTPTPCSISGVALTLDIQDQ